MNKYKRLTEIIPFGEENKISKKEIMSKLNIDEKEATELISQMRKEYIVLTNTTTGGYWRATTKEELIEFVGKQKIKVDEYNEIITIANKEIEKLEGMKEKMESRNTT